jgi:transposase
MARSAPPDTRYLGIDLHKDYLVIGGVNAEQDVVLQPRRFTFEAWAAWSKAHLRKSDVLVVEATSNTWTFYDGVVDLVARVEVANANKVLWIAGTDVKTDRLDVMKLAKLCAAHLIPQVWVPPQPVRELRALFSHRRRLVKVSTLVKNRLQSLLHRHQIKAPSGDLYGEANREWWIALGVSDTERLHIRHDFANLHLVQQQLEEVEAELQRLSTTEPWAKDLPFLMQIPGIGLLSALAIQAAIGDVSRFEAARKLVGYAGLGSRVHDSGKIHRTGRITKSGRRDLRYALIEAARAAVQHHPYWATVAAKLGARIGEKKALVAIARRLLVTIWQVLTKREADLHAEPERVATKFMRWSWELKPQHRQGLQSREFIRWKLEPLGIGAELTHLTYGKMPRRVASAEELWKKRPDLRPPD